MLPSATPLLFGAEDFEETATAIRGATGC